MENKDGTVKEKKTKLCPHCKMEVDSEATRCPHCRGKMRLPREKYKWTTGKKIAVGILGVLFLSAVISSASSSSTNSGSGTVTSGQQGYLRTSKGTTLPVFSTEDALNQFINDGTNNDTYGQEQMVNDGEVFFVSNGTKILVIGMGLATREVRILSGDDVGQSGYVVMEEVSAN